MRTLAFWFLFSLGMVAGVTAIAELPRAYVDTTFPVMTGTVRTVPTGTDQVANGAAFQAALNAAQPGDTIILQAGAVYKGNFVLRPKSGMSNTSWILITSDHLANLPPQGQRVQATDRAFMPEIVTGNAQATIITNPGTQGYWLAGVFIGENSSYSANSYQGVSYRYSYGLLEIGDGSGAQKTLANVPSRIIVDRCYFYAGPLSEVKRAVNLNGAWSAVVDSRIEGMKAIGADAQAIGGTNGPGPFKIENNFLEGSGEIVMFGGADPGIPNLVPSDIVIRHNYFHKPWSWKNGAFLIKNSLETKNNQRVLIEGNIFENGWSAAHDCMIALKSSNQNGLCPWCVAKDITFRNNIVRNGYDAFFLITGDDYSRGGVVSMRNLDIQNNLIYNMTGKYLVAFVGGGTQPASQGGLPNPSYNVTVDHNTMISYSKVGYTDAFFFSGGAWGVVQYFVGSSNIMAILGGPGSPSAIAGDAVTSGTPALSRHTGNTTIAGNIFLGTPANEVGVAANNTIVPARTTDFTNAAALDYSLLPSSPLKGKGVGGTDPGADLATIQAATSGVITGIWGPCTVTTWTPNVAALCGSVAQSSNCATSRVTTGGVTCGAGQTCVANTCQVATCTVTTWSPNATTLCGTVNQTSNCGTNRTTTGSITCTPQQACTNNQCIASAMRVGDRNGDGRVDTIDLAIIVGALGQSGSSQDLTGDGKVDVYDLITLTRDWG